MRQQGFSAPNEGRRHVAAQALGTAAELFPITTSLTLETPPQHRRQLQGDPVNGIIYIVGLIVVVLVVLSFLGLR